MLDMSWDVLVKKKDQLKPQMLQSIKGKKIWALSQKSVQQVIRHLVNLPFNQQLKYDNLLITVKINFFAGFTGFTEAVKRRASNYL